MKAKIIKKETEKRALFDRLSSAKQKLMFFYDEEPGEYLQHVQYERLSQTITIVHPPYQYETLEKWLYLGNWQAVFPGNKDYQIYNTFKATFSGIENKMKDAKISLIIDSFHDNIEWNVIELP